MKNNKGFTLIELIVVIAILGVLALILVPQFMGYVDDADIQTQRTNTKALYDSGMAACAKLRTLPQDERTVGEFSKYLTDGLGDSFAGRFTVKVQTAEPSQPNVTSVYTVTSKNNSSAKLPQASIKSVKFDDCTYDVKTNKYSGSCADVSGS